MHNRSTLNLHVRATACIRCVREAAARAARYLPLCVSDPGVCPRTSFAAYRLICIQAALSFFSVDLEVNSCLMVIALQRQDIGKCGGG